MLDADYKSIPVRIKILSGPQVCFPFPGMPEVNVVAEFLGPVEEKESDDFPTMKIVPVIIEKSLPSVGEEVIAKFFPSSFYIVGEELIPSGAEQWRIFY